MVPPVVPTPPTELPCRHVASFAASAAAPRAAARKHWRGRLALARRTPSRLSAPPPAAACDGCAAAIIAHRTRRLARRRDRLTPPGARRPPAAPAAAAAAPAPAPAASTPRTGPPRPRTQRKVGAPRANGASGRAARAPPNPTPPHPTRPSPRRPRRRQPSSLPRSLPSDPGGRCGAQPRAHAPTTRARARARTPTRARRTTPRRISSRPAQFRHVFHRTKPQNCCAELKLPRLSQCISNTLTARCPPHQRPRPRQNACILT